MSNTPSDAEIDEVTLDVLGYAALDKETNETARMIARAVLAKWAAPQQEAQSYSEKWDAELGRTAMRFVDRAGDVHPGIDDAATICAEFHKAMSEVIERMPHVQRMAAPKAAHQPAPAPLSDDVVKDAARYRWLIDQHWIQTEVDWRLISTHQDSTIRQLDAAIDAALAAQGGKA